MTNILAWLLRDYGNIVLHELHCEFSRLFIRHPSVCIISVFLKIFFYSDFRICRKKEEDCFHSKGVLRVSFGCFIFFSFMFFTTLGTRKLNQIRNSWHSNWWILKLILYLLSVTVSFLIPDVYIHIYGNLAAAKVLFVFFFYTFKRIFLLLQLVSVIQFITWCNDNWMPDSRTKQCCLIGLFFATISYIASYSGIVAMYFMYAPETSCIFNIFFITWTAILVNILMIVSLHSKVNRGLLSSAVMSSYIVFLCWSTIQRYNVFHACSFID
ncbi:putative serine incorporator/TMS membrane protein [Dioscorea sansibarensis]